jgi:hypothetical protein
MTPPWSGWGMSTFATPWNPESGSLGSGFRRANASLLKAMVSGDFVSSQFAGQSPSKLLDELSWRHYVVYCSAALAGKASTRARVAAAQIVECGVCDGMSTYFALSALDDMKVKYAAKLYDAWAAMELRRLLPVESRHAGDYDYLDLERTKRNLARWKDKVTYVRGTIPESFIDDPAPDQIAWMHIDLNAAVATREVLNRFGGHMLPTGMLLFDDYAHGGYEDTRRIADEFAASRASSMVCLPTGQGLWCAGA